MGRLCALQRAPGGRRAHPPCAAACARFKGRQTGRSRIPGALIINRKQHSVSLRMYIFHTQPLSRGLRLSLTPTQQQNATTSFWVCLQPALLPAAGGGAKAGTANTPPCAQLTVALSSTSATTFCMEGVQKLLRGHRDPKKHDFVVSTQP